MKQLTSNAFKLLQSDPDVTQSKTRMKKEKKRKKDKEKKHKKDKEKKHKKEKKKSSHVKVAVDNHPSADSVGRSVDHLDSSDDSSSNGIDD